MTGPHILLVEFGSGGHHLGFVESIVNLWIDRGVPGRLTIAVTEDFDRAHPSFSSLVRQTNAAGLRLHVMPTLEASSAGSRFKQVAFDLRAGRAVRRLIESVVPDHCVLMYVDSLQLSLGFGLRFKRSVKLSGIYFRPSFHYGRFETKTPFREKLERWRKRAVLTSALRNSHLYRLFCLDVYAVPAIQRLSRVPVVYLPDGVSHRPSRLRTGNRRHEVDGSRTTALLFGVIEARKGVFEILEALRHLSPDGQNSLKLLIAGPTASHEAARIEAAIERSRRETDVEIEVRDAWLAEEEVDALFLEADVTMLAYQGHIGTSNVLIRSAASGVPVIASDYGLIGAEVRTRGLGITVDAGSPKAIAAALSEVQSAGDVFPFDPLRANAFADEHTSEAFASILLSELGAIHPD